MAESAVATLAGRSARLGGVGVAPIVSRDAAPDGRQPEATASSRAARAIVRRMAVNLVGSSCRLMARLKLGIGHRVRQPRNPSPLPSLPPPRPGGSSADRAPDSGARERLHELTDTSRVDRRSHPLGGGFGGSLEAHESAHERVETGVRGVALGADKQRVEAMLWVSTLSGTTTPRRRRRGAPIATSSADAVSRPFRRSLESLPNEVAAGQVVRGHVDKATPARERMP